MRGLLIFLTIILICCLAKCSPVELLPQKTQERKTRELNCIDSLSNDTDVYITLSALVSVDNIGTINAREIELNWNATMAEEGDQVGLFDSDPMVNASSPLVLISARQQNGKFRTAFKFGYPYIPAGVLGDHCLGYWIAYFKKGSVVNQDCFKLRPTWMRDNRDVLKDIPMRNLFIPGTHNSGSFDIYAGAKSENVVKRYTVNQDDSIWDQLMFGIRYLDFRVGYYPENKENPFWINHDVYPMNPIDPMIQDIKRFLETTNEIVIIDFHRFPVGFDSSETHIKFIVYILESLGHLAAPNYHGKDVTLEDMWSNGFKLIISYNVKDASNQISRLWNPVTQFWGNKQKKNALMHYLRYLMIDRYRRHYYWASMAELTPRLIDVLLRPTKGLRFLADSINSDLTLWFRDSWWDAASIVATDFYHGNNMIDVAIRANLARATCPSD